MPIFTAPRTNERQDHHAKLRAGSAQRLQAGYFYLELSSRTQINASADEVWDTATRVLAEVGSASGLELVDDQAVRPSTVQRFQYKHVMRLDGLGDVDYSGGL